MEHIFLLIILVLVILICSKSFEHFDDNNFVMPKADIKMSQKIKDRGMFANKKYFKGDIIEVCPCIIDNNNNFSGKMRDYLFSYDKDRSLVAFGYCSMYNHSDNNNALWKVLPNNKLQIYAVKDIDIGEEIFISYGNQYWKSRNATKL